MLASLVTSAHYAHASVVALRPMADDPLTPTKTKMPTGMATPIKAALGVGIMLFIIVAVFMLLRALFDAVTAYKDGAAVPFGSIIMIVVFLAIAVGGVSGLVFLVVPDGWLA